MPSLNFEQEKKRFRDFYNENQDFMERAKDSFVSIIKSIFADKFEISQIIGRVKDREEAIKKFSLKYQFLLEEEQREYEIKDHISDLIGIRMVCLYENDIEEVKKVLKEEFEIIDIIDKIAKVESREDTFGYKGLHMDLQIKDPRTTMTEYQKYTTLNFEIQIRTIIQDAWSVLDHKIKYKKSIPLHLKRRINVLAALFELADREFYSIKADTIKLSEEEKKKTKPPEADEALNAFTFLSIMEKEFPDYTFKPSKVDDIVEEINSFDYISPKGLKETLDKSKGQVNNYKEKLSKEDNVKHALNPYTFIRHVLFLLDREKYKKILYINQRKSFESWLGEVE